MSTSAAVYRDTLHKWLASLGAIGAVIFGMMAYYIQTQDNIHRAALQAQLDIVAIKLDANEKVISLVVLIDKRLSGIEAILARSTNVENKVDTLREDFTAHKLEVAARRTL